MEKFIEKFLVFIEVLPAVIGFLISFLFLFAKLQKSKRLMNLLYKVIPFIQKGIKIDPIQIIESDPDVRFTRAKTFFVVMFDEQVNSIDISRKLEIMQTILKHARDNYFYGLQLNMGSSKKITSNGIMAVMNVVESVINYNGICLDVILPESGNETGFPKLLTRLVKAIGTRNDIKILLEKGGKTVEISLD